MSAPAGAPRATYRFQVHSGFRIPDVQRAVAHLQRLGISHAHVSPLTAARPGSTHGYDVVDPSRIGEELGGEVALDELVEELHGRGLGLILDIVPNHEAAHPLNARWQDVLRHGVASEHARRYDIDWERGGGQVLRPILEHPFGEALERGDLALRLADGDLVLMAGEIPLPLDPRTWGQALSLPSPGEGTDVARAIEALARASRDVPPRADLLSGSLASRRERSARLRADLAAVAATDSGAKSIQARLSRMSGSPGDAGSFDSLEALVRSQAWRLTSWTVAAEDVNYRRFFDITDLVGVRVEDPAVFEATHELPLALAARGALSGLRIDHVDGLREPRAYLERLASHLRDAAGPGAFLVVEKILSGNETLPASWPVHGTTGYETLNAITGALVDPAGLQRLQADYARRTGRARTLRQSCARRKAQVMREILRGDEQRLVVALHEIAREDRHACDVTRSDLRLMLGALTAWLGVYRTYREPGSPATTAERLVVQRAVRDAQPLAHAEGQRRALDFLGRILLQPLPGIEHALTRFVMRWQQFTGPVMAKGLEDTAFYVQVPLLAMNDVGGDVDGGRAFAGPEAFHLRMEATLRSGRPGLAPTSTHDTKRGEDARARLALLSDAPERWNELLEIWRVHEPAVQRVVGGRLVPDANERELLCQSLLGAWPASRAAGWRDELMERFGPFVTKALREAKTHSSWLWPDVAYEDALVAFMRDVLARPDREPLLSFAAFADEVAAAGVVGSLTQAVVRAALPGAPEIYQGSQSWNLALVDPDNRRPVDHDELDASLREIESRWASRPQALAKELLASWPDGRVKLLATWASLQARRRDPALVTEGRHVPLRVEGGAASAQPLRALAFARSHEGRAAIVVAPLGVLGPSWRCHRPLAAAWAGASIPLPLGLPGAYRDAITSREILARDGALDPSECWRDLPVALLVSP